MSGASLLSCVGKPLKRNVRPLGREELMSNDSSLSFSGDQVQIGKRSWKAEFPIRDAVMLGDKVILLYDPDSSEAIRFRQFQNLVAYSVHGEKLWTGEHPTNETAAVYINFMSSNPLRVWNFACFVCEINPTNGKLIQAQFTK